MIHAGLYSPLYIDFIVIKGVNLVIEVGEGLLLTENLFDKLKVVLYIILHKGWKVKYLILVNQQIIEYLKHMVQHKNIRM
jgi:hypothetical protein